MVDVCVTFLKTARQMEKVLYDFTFPPAVYGNDFDFATKLYINSEKIN